jgi:Ca-activated chloride channel homolog
MTVLATAFAAVLAVPPPVFPSRIGLVILQATVRNVRGEAVAGLEREAFTVYENGKPQAVTLFRGGEVPVSLGIAIDGSRSMRESRGKVAAAALTLLRASRPDDEAFLMSFDEKPRLQVPFTRDVAALETAVRAVDAVGGTAMRDAVAEAAGYLSKSAGLARRCLVVVSDGTDNASTTPMARIRDQARERGLAVYAIGLVDETDPGRAAHGREALEELTEATGGVAYFPRTVGEVESAAARLARQIRSQYTIGYNPSNQALDGSYRKLRVAVRGPQKLTVRTRAGYRATPEGALGNASPEQ